MAVWYKLSQDLSCTSWTGPCFINQAIKSRMSSSTPLSCTVVQLLGKTVWQLLGWLSRVAIWSAIPPLGLYTQKIWKQRLKHDVRDSCSRSHSSWKVEGTQISIYSWMEKLNVAYPCSEIFLGHKKEWSTSTCSSMEEAQKHHAKSNKSNTQG